MNIDPDIIYSKYGTDIGRLQIIAVQKARRLDFILNSENQQELGAQDVDARLLRTLKAKGIVSFSDLANMCERKGKINIPRNDIARLIGFLDELSVTHPKESIISNKKPTSEDVPTNSSILEEEETNNRKHKQDLLEYLVKEFGFDGLYHYTDFSNLKSIFNDGYLYARNAEGNDVFYDAARTINIDRTPDDIKSYVRLFYKENTPTTYRNEGIIANPRSLAHMPIPVLLLFSRRIITHDGVKFLNGSGSNIISNDDVQTSETDQGEVARQYPWEYIFERGRQNWSRDSWPLITNLRNAELLYPKKLDLKYLDRIVFRTDIDMQNALVLFGNDFKEKYVVDPEKFQKDKARHAKTTYYVKSWEKVNYPVEYDFRIEENIVFDITYHNDNIDNYEHRFVVYYHDKDKEELMAPVDFKSYDVRYTLSYDGEVGGIDYYMDDVLCIIWRE